MNRFVSMSVGVSFVRENLFGFQKKVVRCSSVFVGSLDRLLGLDSLFFFGIVQLGFRTTLGEDLSERVSGFGF